MSYLISEFAFSDRTLMPPSFALAWADRPTLKGNSPLLFEARCQIPGESSNSQENDCFLRGSRILQTATCSKALPS
jgi:hypothetical protein